MSQIELLHISVERARERERDYCSRPIFFFAAWPTRERLLQQARLPPAFIELFIEGSKSIIRGKKIYQARLRQAFIELFIELS